MKDYFQVLQFVKQQSATLANANPALAAGADVENSGNIPLIEGGVQISFVAGTIRGGEQERMNRMLFRITRGRALTYFEDFVQDGVPKIVYMVVFQDGAMIRDRVQKICDSFMG